MFEHNQIKDVYKDDLAYIHDAGFIGFAKNAGSLLLEVLHQKSTDSGLVIDLGCGSGILAQHLEAAGYDVLGIDISKAMLAIAKRRVPNAQFRHESFLTAELPSCVAVTAIGECFNYLFDKGNTQQGLLTLFVRIYNALSPGGLLLFDIVSPGRLARANPYRTYTEGEDWAVLMTAEENQQERLLTRYITTFRKMGEMYQRNYEIHKSRLLTQQEVLEQLQSIGFVVNTLSGYGELKFTQGHIGFLAIKP